jgi:hypothetical protein
MIAAITILIAISGAALLLMLFIRIRDTDKELRLDQHRSKAMGFADLLVYAAVVEDGVIVGKNGSLMAAWVFCGDDTASSTEIERERVSFRINQALSRLGQWLDDSCGCYAQTGTRLFRQSAFQLSRSCYRCH